MEKYSSWFVVLLGLTLWSCKESEKPEPKIPDIVLTAPADNAAFDLAAVADVTFEWNATEGITGYNLVLSKSANGDSSQSIAATANPLKVTAGDLDALVAALGISKGATATLYWSVYSTKPRVKTDARLITITRIPASAPEPEPEPDPDPNLAIVLSAPAGGVTINAKTSTFPYTFEWTKTEEVTAYTIRFSKDIAFPANATVSYSLGDANTYRFTAMAFDKMLADLGIESGSSSLYWTVVPSVANSNIQTSNRSITGARTTDRNPLLWPFSPASIWNMPIGSNAQYVDAKLVVAAKTLTDEDYIVMMPEAPTMKIYKSLGEWNSGQGRCSHIGQVLFRAPIPHDWIVSPNTWLGSIPNAGLAVLMEDGKTIRQTQPFAHCTAGDQSTSASYLDVTEKFDIYGTGYYGAHGGSELSAIGGCLRNHELTPTSGPIRHVLKINVYAAKNLVWDGVNKGFRWPARTADSYADSTHWNKELRYGLKRPADLPPVPDCRMGALMALPASLDIATLGLSTEPAKILAKAFQDYGAYIVDDTAWDVNTIITEWSPQGRFIDIFKKNWGFNFETDGSNPWGQDLQKIFSNLHVVANNTAATIGGGGTPRQLLAPAF